MLIRFNPATEITESVLLTEYHTIRYNEANQLFGFRPDELPVRAPAPVITKLSDLSTYTEIFSKTAYVSDNKFYLDYEDDFSYGTGFVKFNSTQDEEIVKIEYYSIGKIIQYIDQRNITKQTKVKKNYIPYEPVVTVSGDIYAATITTDTNEITDGYQSIKLYISGDVGSFSIALDTIDPIDLDRVYTREKWILFADIKSDTQIKNIIPYINNTAGIGSLSVDATTKSAKVKYEFNLSSNPFNSSSNNLHFYYSCINPSDTPEWLTIDDLSFGQKKVYEII